MQVTVFAGEINLGVEIKPESEPILAQVADLLGANPELKLKIQGHTDNVGSRDENLKLSAERARSVVTYLVERHKVSSERLSSEGLGDTVPVADNRTEAGRAQNRRVELVKQ